jgi:hypothetical protein
MHVKKWLRLSLMNSILFVLSLSGINYLIDPYGFNNFFIKDKINSKKFSNTGFTTSFKADIINNGGFDSIFLGSSRIGVMNPEIINKELNLKTFNLAYQGSITKIHNKLFFYANHFNSIKYLFYGIDFLSFNKNLLIERDYKDFYSYQEEVENFKDISLISKYFSLDTFLKSITLVSKNILGIQKIDTQYSNKNGMRNFDNYKFMLEENNYNINVEIKTHIDSYFVKNGLYDNYEFSYENLEYFKEIIEYCKNNSIKVYVYIPPINVSHLMAIRDRVGYFQFELFKRELAQITDFVDFTGINNITTNNSNYWDSSHLKKELTSTIFNELLKEKNKHYSLVNKNNIEEHLKKLKKDLENFILHNLKEGE